MEEITKLVVLLVLIFAPYIIANSITVIVNTLIKVIYPAYKATQSANEKARQNMENIK